MLIILSPAKIQNFKEKSTLTNFTLPEYLKDAEKLVKLMRELSPYDLVKLLEINANLSQLNFDRYFNWHLPFSLENAKQASIGFDGEVFRGLNAKTFSESQMSYAQDHLRILSGLYGVLRPMDLIQPYRLEISSKLNNKYGRDLYAFWKDKITKSIIRDLKQSGEPQFILNLASSEYIKSIDLKKRGLKKIDVEFYEYQQDKIKQIVIYTKKARGMMARYVIENKIETLEDLKGFSSEGYWYYPEMSNDSKLVFVRSGKA